MRPASGNLWLWTEVQYNILNESGSHKKQVRLIRIFIPNTSGPKNFRKGTVDVYLRGVYNSVLIKFGKRLSGTITIHSGLKQCDALAIQLLNFAYNSTSHTGILSGWIRGLISELMQNNIAYKFMIPECFWSYHSIGPPRNTIWFSVASLSSFDYLMFTSLELLRPLISDLTRQ